MPKVRVLATSFIGHSIREPGYEFEYSQHFGKDAEFDSKRDSNLELVEDEEEAPKPRKGKAAEASADFA